MIKKDLSDVKVIDFGLAEEIPFGSNLEEIKEDLLTNDNTEERERLIEEENEQNNIIDSKKN